MSQSFAVEIDPTQTKDAARQAAIEKRVYNAVGPGPEVRNAILQALHKEPVEWIRKLEVRLLKRCPFDAESLLATAALLSSPHPDVRLEAAALLQQTITLLVAEKRVTDRKEFETRLLPVLVESLKKETGPTWLEVYKTVARFTSTEGVQQVMLDLLPVGGETALLVFAQAAQKLYPPKALNIFLSSDLAALQGETAIHILRALAMTLPKEGAPVGYPNTATVIQALLVGLASRVEDVRKEAAITLGTRAKAAKKQKEALPLEDEVWNALFALYETRLPSTTAPDRDHAKEALRELPPTPERMERVFTLMHRVTDELQKQNVVDLVGTFKTAETKQELIKMLKVNFAGLRLEAQKTTINSASGFIPDADVEAEMEKLLEGKGLHADIQAKLADYLFADLPSLKARLGRWLRIDAKSGRPVLERFELPMMHIKIIESAKKLPGDSDVRKLLVALLPLLIMNDANVKLNETLRDFPDGTPGESLSMEQMATTLLPLLVARTSGRVVFKGFTLPAAFGGSSELEFGNVKQTNAQGLGLGAAQMANDFVKKLVQDLFSGQLGEFVPPGTPFQLTEEGGVFTISAVQV
jgi:hypothetical protein